ncbi:hypothetical protein PAXRUDRAFT_35142 [Paxillus rubicundulus Ve08.2h10]|uniref:Uncharacterized protein n=1 Tax=Paxillus rubicundulus Ve08.2h10 TaxID=930991 RepID=A0A0D0D3C0_9AGAM|nr:hypothetical protein PAXRUDRAFT_35142 [Paxillus rubicundulus Ve08.2h10]
MTTQKSIDVYVDLALDHLSDVTTALDAMCAPARSHPYTTVVSLIVLGAFPAIIISPLKLLALPFKALGKFVLYHLGFRPGGVERDSFASHYQSINYGGYIPANSPFAHLQSYGTEDDEEAGSWFASIVSWSSFAGAGYVLGRAWGWWN